MRSSGRDEAPSERARHLQHPRTRRPTRAAASARCAISSRAATCRCSPRPSASRPSTAACRSTWSSCRSARSGKITGIGVHAGLWTSQALTLPAEEVPVLRRRLEQLDKEFGFDPKGHTGKALRHAVASLPRDLLVNLSVGCGARAGDDGDVARRPAAARPCSGPEHPQGPFVRVRLAAARGADHVAPHGDREMLERRSAREVTSWSVELGDGDLALIRYTQYIERRPAAARRRGARRGSGRDGPRLGAGVEAELIAAVGAGPGDPPRAHLSARAFPDSYRARTSPEEARRRHPAAAAARATTTTARVRIWRSDDGHARPAAPQDLSHGALIPLSEAVPVLENFGFRVLEEMPTALGGGTLGYIHDFRLEIGSEADLDDVMAARRRDRARDRRRAERRGRERRVQPAGAVRRARSARPVVWLRAWFRYLRQTGSAFGLVTVVDALRRAPKATARADPACSPPPTTRRLARGRDAQVDKQRDRVRRCADARCARSTTTASCACCARWSTRRCAPTPSLRRPPRRSPSRSIRRWCPGLPAPVPWREIWVYSPRVEGIHLRGGPIARGGLRWSDRRDDFRTEILGLMKAQMVKNAVIVPTGAKGGFYPKQLPARHRTATPGWPKAPKAIASSSARLLSVTDNIVNDKVVHPDERRHPRRRRSLFRRRRRQGHRDLLRRRQRDRARAQFLARRRLRQRRLQRLRPQGDGDHRQGRLDLGPAPLPRDGRRRPDGPDHASSAAATCRATCSATACCCRRRSSWSRPSTIATSSSIPIPIRRRAGPSASGCSTCRARAGTITTAS